ncbi:CehA/McbA family metallohydrolase [Streptantibioticus parmotrematis]|uniref:CehA/McbA family metallohydrolase n=1 Tax=Streptantibioticus parmotrematis TaxID=2873249 RepID=UPI0033EBB7A3
MTQQPSGDDDTLVLRGQLPPGARDFVEVPFAVPDGVREIAVSYAYERPDVPDGTLGNACDIGLLDADGRFRGWSGGARDSFRVGERDATPGYLPGPIAPGTWRVLLGPYTVAPQGLPYEIHVTLHHTPAIGPPAPAPAYPPFHAPGRGRSWYRGDCHLHTVHSDGSRTPAELAAAARAARLDFIVSTEHNTTSAHAAFAAEAGDDLLILTGEEITTRNGHLLALGTDPGTWFDWRFRARDEDAFARTARAIRRAGGLVVPAHPYGLHLGSQWKFGYEHADAVEVWNGTWTLDDEAALATWDNLLGHRVLPAMGNSDAHREPQVVGLPQTVVLADALERGAILDGLRAGRSWIAESADVDVEFEAVAEGGARAGIGDTLPVRADEPVAVTLTVTGVPDPVVRLVTDEGQTHLAFTERVEWRTTSAATAYVRAEVRHAGNGTMAALTNPIRLLDTPTEGGR